MIIKVDVNTNECHIIKLCIHKAEFNYYLTLPFHTYLTYLSHPTAIVVNEKKAYLTLNEPERAKFEEQFWSDKAVTAKEYSDRAGYIDGKFGSGKPGSGVNTDQGRIYLALGPPNRFPASMP